MTETPFGDLDDYFALPRVSALAVSPDGSRVVTRISELNGKLFLAGLTAPEIADQATRRYVRAWLRFPVAMGVATIGRYRDHFIALGVGEFVTGQAV